MSKKTINSTLLIFLISIAFIHIMVFVAIFISDINFIFKMVLFFIVLMSFGITELIPLVSLICLLYKPKDYEYNFSKGNYKKVYQRIYKDICKYDENTIVTIIMNDEYKEYKFISVENNKVIFKNDDSILYVHLNEYKTILV